MRSASQQRRAHACSKAARHSSPHRWPLEARVTSSRFCKRCLRCEAECTPRHGASCSAAGVRAVAVGAEWPVPQRLHGGQAVSGGHSMPHYVSASPPRVAPQDRRAVHSKRPSPHNSPLHWQSTPTQVLIATYLTRVHAQRARASPKHGCTWTAAHAESRLTCGPRAVTQRWHHPGTAPARAPARPPARRPRPAAGPLRAARRPGARPPLVESPPWGRAPRRHHTHSRASPRPLRQPRRRRAPQRQPRRARAPLRPQARRPQRQGGSHSRQRPLRRTPGPPRPPTQPRGRPARRRRRRRPAARGGAPPRPPRRARSGSGSGQPWTRRRAAGAGPARARARPPAGPSPPARRRGAGSRTGGLLAARR